MSKKYYIMLAKLLRKYQDCTIADKRFIDELMSELKQDNPNFDKDKFFNAVFGK